MYVMSDSLRAFVPGQTKDVEEKEQCERLHELIREYKLEGQLRWLVAQKDRVANGELYRYIAGARPCCTFAGIRDITPYCMPAQSAMKANSLLFLPR